jgi:signal transduction histidine kinase
MDVVIVALVAAVVFGAIGLSIGLGRGRAQGVQQGVAEGIEKGRSDAQARLSSLVEAVRRGRTLPGLTPGTPEAELQDALEQGWAPREAEREAALREAVGRVSSFLDKNVRGPLSGIEPGAGVPELRDRIARALGALQDLDFFVQEASEFRQGADVVALVQRVTKEFVADQGLGVRLAMSHPTVPASVNPTALMDALYLVLHNAGRFGGGGTVDVTVARDGSRATVTVRDRGPGFSEEAFKRAFDPFYSTTDDGLGLGLPHARRAIEAMGGEIELRNVPGGGAEVEISLPTT